MVRKSHSSLLQFSSSLSVDDYPLAELFSFVCSFNDCSNVFGGVCGVRSAQGSGAFGTCGEIGVMLKI